MCWINLAQDRWAPVNTVKNLQIPYHTKYFLTRWTTRFSQTSLYHGICYFVHQDLLKIQFPCTCTDLEFSIIAFFPTCCIMEDYTATTELWIHLHFFTIWITSSSCITWCTPTRCGEYLVLVPCTRKENIKITVKKIYFQNIHWEIPLLNDTPQLLQLELLTSMFLCSNWQHW